MTGGQGTFAPGSSYGVVKKRGGMRLPVKSAVLASMVICALAFAGTAGGAPSAVQAAPKASFSASSSAQVALQRALSVFAPEHATASYRAAAAKIEPRFATLLLRDLVAQLARLSKSDRRLARVILARPTDGASEGAAGWDGVPRRYRERDCTPRFCVHWVTRGDEKPSLRDRRPRNGRPDWVDKTIAHTRVVWEKEVGTLGYKRPLPDGSSSSHHGGNPNRRIDIFIAEIGDQGLYGYCTTDEPRPRRTNNRQVSAYCVVDNDFRRAEFQSGAYGVNALKVTLAHEFFHAVQFAYDYFDNRAMMEGTAVWMEDQVYDGVNDNRQYLPNSPLGNPPWAPLDLFATSGQFNGWQYGTWIWYRFLSEHFGPGARDDLKIIRQIWQKAVGSRNGFAAIAAALADRVGSPTVLEKMTTFGRWNTAPRRFYREGAGQEAGPPYPLPAKTVVTLGDTPEPIALDMLRRSNDYYDFRRGASLGAMSTLEFTGVNLPTTAGSLLAVVFRPSGDIASVVPVPDGSTTSVEFDSDVSKVILVFTNASGADFVDPDPNFQVTADAAP
jgi:hypothetical protein